MMKEPTTQGQEPRWKRIDEFGVYGPDGHELYVIEIPSDLTVAPRKKGDGRQPVRLTLPGGRSDRPVLTSREYSALMPMCYMLFGLLVAVMSQYLHQ